MVGGGYYGDCCDDSDTNGNDGVVVMVVVDEVSMVEANACLLIVSWNLTTLSRRQHLGDKERAGTSQVI